MNAIKLAASLEEMVSQMIKRVEEGIEFRLNDFEKRFCVMEQRLRDIELAAQNPQETAAVRGNTSADPARTITDILAIRRSVSAHTRLSAHSMGELKLLCTEHHVRATGIKAEIVDRLTKEGADPLELELSFFTKQQLVQACEERKIPKSGNKSDLAWRLLHSVETPPAL